MADFPKYFNLKDTNLAVSFGSSQISYYNLVNNEFKHYTAQPYNKDIGATTGYTRTIYFSDGSTSTVYEVRLYDKISTQYATSGYYIWVDENSVATFDKLNEVNEKTATDLINNIITKNQQILINNLVCSAIVDNMEYKEKEVPQSVYDTITSLQQRLQKRNQKLIDKSWLTGVKQGTPEYFSKYQTNLQSVVNKGRIGFVITISVATIITVSLIIGAIIATLIFRAFSSDNDEAQKDIELSEDFINVLKKLSPEDVEIAEAEVQNAYDEGYKLGKGSNTLMNMFKAGAIFFVSLVGYRMYKDSQIKKNQ